MFYHEYSSYYVTKDKIKVSEKKKKKTCFSNWGPKTQQNPKVGPTMCFL